MESRRWTAKKRGRRPSPSWRAETSEDVLTQHETHYQGSTHGCSTADWSPSGRLGMCVVRRRLSEATTCLFVKIRCMFIVPCCWRFQKFTNFARYFVRWVVENCERHCISAGTDWGVGDRCSQCKDFWAAAHGEDGENHAGADAGAPKLSKMKHVTFWSVFSTAQLLIPKLLPLTMMIFSDM